MLHPRCIHPRSASALCPSPPSLHACYCFLCAYLQTSGISSSRLDECCGTAARPAAGLVAACTTDITAFNVEKSQVAPTCANLPNAGTTTTSSSCASASTAYSTGSSTSCARGFCAASGFGRRLRQHAAKRRRAAA
jgi:hypothetical protein